MHVGFGAVFIQPVHEANRLPKTTNSPRWGIRCAQDGFAQTWGKSFRKAQQEQVPGLAGLLEDETGGKRVFCLLVCKEVVVVVVVLQCFLKQFLN